MTTASLIESISVSGYGAAAASGSAYFYLPGTTTRATVYQDSEAGTAYTQPIVLDSNGRAFVPVFATDAVRMQVFSAGGVLLVDTDQENVVTAGQVAINNAGWAADLADVLDAASASFGTAGSLVKLPGSTTVARPVNQKMADFGYSVTDFGAKGDGRTDDTAAIQAAFAHVQSVGSGTIIIPAGTYITSGAITFTSATGSLRIQGDGRPSKIKRIGAAGNIFTISLTVGTLMIDSISLESNSSGDDGIVVSSAFNITAINVIGAGFPSAGARYLFRLPITYASILSSVATDITVAAVGNLVLTTGLGTNLTVVGSVGDVVNTANTVNITAVGGVGIRNNQSASLAASMTIAGGNFIASTAGATPYVASPLASTSGASYGTDSAGDYTKTITGTGTTTLEVCQSTIILSANTAGITVTYAITTPGMRNVRQQTIRFFNNTAGAVTWTAGTGVTLRGAAPAPGAGASVYITFAYDKLANSMVEVSRT